MKYVRKGKVAEEVFVKYFGAIEEALRKKFTGLQPRGGDCEEDGYDTSLYGELRKLLPELTKQEYDKSHRNRLEYLLKLVEKEVVKRLREP